MFAFAASRSITSYKRGNSSRATGWAPLEYNAILSEKKYANAFETIANPSPMTMPPRPPRYCPTITRNSVNAVSKNVVRKILIESQCLSTANISTYLDTRRGGRLFRPAAFEPQRFAPAIAIDEHMISRQNLAFQNLHRERILNHPLNRPPQRPRTVRWVVAFTEQEFIRSRRQCQRNLALCEKSVDTLEQQPHDSPELFLA